MSVEQTNHNIATDRLRDEGYTVRLEKSCIVISDIPYLDASKTVHEDGYFVDTYPPTDHTVRFSHIPHTVEGKELLVAGKVNDWNGFSVQSQLSFKKTDGKSKVPYEDLYEKVVHYVNVISAHAKSLKPEVSAQKFRPVDTSDIEESVFQYHDLNSSRAGINHVNEKLKGQKVAIIGLGGTGSYVLDLVSKSNVSEIHIYDHDTFHVHNAFRAPGAANSEALDQGRKKVLYFHEVYSHIHKGIYAHDQLVTSEVMGKEFEDYNFVFVCMDANDSKKGVLLQLIESRVPFVDCGIGVDEVDGALNGTVRLTTITPSKSDHLNHRIHLNAQGQNEYNSNIQIAELNALNAALAVIKWKRVMGFYHDHQTEHHSTYMFNCNSLSNDETI